MHKGLGKGLQSLIPPMAMPDTAGHGQLQMIPVVKIRPNKYQARRSFDENKLQELASSIKQHGLAQPVLVTPSDQSGMYELIAGERRLRACAIAGLTRIPAMVKKTTEQEKFQLSLIENLQRDDLNPMEESEGYSRLIKEFSLTQETLSGMLGISRSAIANTLRLLSLPESIQEGIRVGKIQAGHARALATLEDREQQERLAAQIITDKLTTRDIERLVRGLKSTRRQESGSSGARKSPEVIEIENRLQHLLGTKVRISYRKEKGSISIFFYSLDHFDSLIATLKGKFKN